MFVTLSQQFARVIENAYRSYKKKYGMGHSISVLLCNHMGYHQNVKTVKIPHTYLNDGMKKLLVNKQDMMGLSLKKTVEDNLVRQIRLNTYKGTCIRSGLPLHGQRRRTNASTVHKLLSKIATRARKV